MLRAGAESCTVPFVTMADEAYCDFIGPPSVRFSACCGRREKVISQAITTTALGSSIFFFSEKYLSFQVRFHKGQNILHDQLAAKIGWMNPIPLNGALDSIYILVEEREEHHAVLLRH